MLVLWPLPVWVAGNQIPTARMTTLGDFVESHFIALAAE